MAHPLSSAYNWRTPVVVATAALILCLGLLIHSPGTGWIGVAAAIVLLWAAFIAVVWLRTRAYLMVDGPTLTVRHYRGFHSLDGRRLVRVRQYPTGSGPCYRVRLVDDPRSYAIPCALLSQGHSTFFGWVLRYAPEVERDRGSERTIEQLRTRGLLE